MEIVLATWKKAKVDWLTKGFSHLEIKVLPLDKKEIDDVEDSGNTSTENALIKVRAFG